MNSAKLNKSDRLKRVLKILKRGGAYTTLQLALGARVCAVNSIVSELRDNGYRISCRCFGSGEKRVFKYMLESA